MAQPPGFVDQSLPHYRCRLRRSLYGLKQAPRVWYQSLSNYLISLGFRKTISDASLFVFRDGDVQMFVLVYVDDIIITGSSDSAIRKTIDALSTKFSLKDLGDLHYFLGIQIHPSANGILLCQRKYLQSILETTKMDLEKPIHTPMLSSSLASAAASPGMSDPSLFRKVIGSLQYLLLTRPDIAFSVNRLAQKSHNPTEADWSDLKRVLRYLKGSLDFGLFLPKSTDLSLHGYSDSDWAGDHTDRFSTSGYLIFLGPCLISWKSAKQRTIARSSTEAEYRALASTAAELAWIQSFLSEIGFSSPTAPSLFCDNVGATYLASNPVFQSRMKHIAIDYHFVRQRVQSGELKVLHISSKDQLADT